MFEGLERITYQLGDQIFHEGEQGDCAYLLESGRVPVDNIKVDRSFITRMLSNDSSMQIVKGSIDLARSMGLEVVAEGVESKEEIEQLNDMHCFHAQGYYYAKPLPLQEAIEFSQSNS